MTVTHVENTYATFNNNKKFLYTHYFDINVAMQSMCEEGEDISSEVLYDAFLMHIKSIPPQDFLEHCNLFASDPVD